MFPNRLAHGRMSQTNTHIAISDFLYVMRYINHLYIGDIKTKGLWPVSAMSVPHWLTAECIPHVYRVQVWQKTQVSQGTSRLHIFITDIMLQRVNMNSERGLQTSLHR